MVSVYISLITHRFWSSFLMYICHLWWTVCSLLNWVVCLLCWIYILQIFSFTLWLASSLSNWAKVSNFDEIQFIVSFFFLCYILKIFAKSKVTKFFFSGFPLHVLYFKLLHLGLWFILSQFLYVMWDKGRIFFLYTAV